jgi:hypothetical protein
LNNYIEQQQFEIEKNTIINGIFYYASINFSICLNISSIGCIQSILTRCHKLSTYLSAGIVSFLNSLILVFIALISASSVRTYSSPQHFLQLVISHSINVE